MNAPIATLSLIRVALLEWSMLGLIGLGHRIGVDPQSQQTMWAPSLLKDRHPPIFLEIIGNMKQ